MKKYLLAALLSTSLLFLVGCIEPAEETTTTTKAIKVKEPYITIKTQKLISEQLTVKEAYLDRPGYVVIHANKDFIGGIIARSPIMEGTGKDIKINVLNYSGQSPLYAVIHYDNGDGVFQYPGPDSPDDNPVIEKFIITEGATTTTTTTTSTTTTEYTPKTEYIKMDNFEFQPDNLMIREGDTVRWMNQESAEHRIYIPSILDTGILKKGEGFSHTFEREGIYKYVCKIHPSMRGRIIVEGVNS